MANTPEILSIIGLPPIVPNIKQTLESYLQNPERLPIHRLKNNLEIVPSERNIQSCFQFHRTYLPLIHSMRRDPATGKITGYEEIESDAFFGETAKNSLSLKRAPGPKDQLLRGNSANYPFWPGGFDENKEASNSKIIEDLDETEDLEIFTELFEKNLLLGPPGIEGIDFQKDEPKTNKEEIDLKFLKDDAKFDFWQGKEKTVMEDSFRQINKQQKKEMRLKRLLKEIPSEESLVPVKKSSEVAVLKISQTPSNSRVPTSLPWAEMVDMSRPMADFHDRVPDMAFKPPFELDTFQKEAVVRLEEHQNVFVAAHTSAGKTVVAEYAIALSVRHMTRTIYTSPIKALSNQKFRDFKNSFESVGLVTGDVQINPTAACLIMTTEILRSMLYNGSDVIRDLEWVVFDEIHYLNNEERGHVWEEVLIMLPQHVSIIMLSATVPNALQFANWVGEIKKKKIYVISTSKRPVPLEHFLYTGSGGKTKNEQFLILDAEGKFLKKGYDNAKEAKLSRTSKHQQNYGPRGARTAGFSENSEKTTYIGLINHLKENDKLPVVIFTFSRNRCDSYANLMTSVDLCTGAQKAEIHGFFQQCTQRLKGSDRELPQVLQVQTLLKNGIGVHHSGILPILKEVVEMLFQRGLVKLLFATETFAMGVNMPARTVVFDSCRKHDGISFRSLNPAEYIQMAGRAGRRGLDTTGTVIILCKHGVPDYYDLEMMLLGKAAKLESQFRLTYSMILNLLRVESLSVEDVMKRSFMEAGNRTLKIDEIVVKKKNIEEQLLKLEWNSDGTRIEEDSNLMEFYAQAKDVMNLRNEVMGRILHHPKMVKEMIPGTLIIFHNFPNYCSRPGILLGVTTRREAKIQKTLFNVITLKAKSDSESLPIISDSPHVKLLSSSRDYLDNTFQYALYLANNQLYDFRPDYVDWNRGYSDYRVMEIEVDKILDVIHYGVRIEPQAILNDVKKREQERFRRDIPANSVLKVLFDLYDITVKDLNAKPENQLKPINPLTSIEFSDPSLMNMVANFVSFKERLKRSNIGSTPGFIPKFREVFLHMLLVEGKEHFEYLLSPKSLRLHEQYQSRIAVLQKLGYIDADCLVQLKGRVACEMGNQNELLITEMVLENVLTDCAPEEIAALVSSLVFEAKNVDEPKLPESPLNQKVVEIKALAKQIGIVQRECGMTDQTVDQYVETLKFGLLEVVYEWAKGKPFAEIMKLTDVQEGLIVRTIQRLDEMLRDVKDAARIIGDPSLKKKMEEASECIRRDIVFAASLYTQ